ncbi:MAG TPA: right-handed parallel beta-helix repeat-containing protein [Gaiellaceae bacterium]|nr:right-handed parallel beta-helix repeat-containing protein [Gaiellaceae bacterium]
MSYTLRGRIESRLFATLVVLLGVCAVAAALPAFWPLELVALMLVVGVVMDTLLYSAIEYQPGWYALPLGALELVLTMGLARVLGIDPPFATALAVYGGAWLAAQALAQAGFPLFSLSYAENGGELGRAGAIAGAASLAVLASAGGLAWAKQPPTVHLSAGIHQGPLVITRRETLVGDRGAVVRGGIVIRANHVTVRNVAVVGGQNGIDVEHVHGVVLDHVSVVGAALDGIHVRLAQVMVKGCTVSSPAGYTQGIDISFAMGMGESMIEGCTISGGREGIVTHSASVTVMGNRVSATSLRGIAMTEMSMGMIESNQVTGSQGIGILCVDQSECMISRNQVSGTRSNQASGDLGQKGYGIESNFLATAELSRNELYGNAHRVGTFSGGTVSYG